MGMEVVGDLAHHRIQEPLPGTDAPVGHQFELGQHVVAVLRQVGCAQVFVPRSADFDLSHEQDIRAAASRTF